VILICSINSYAEEIKPLPENIKSYQTSNFLNYLEKAAQETRKEAENGNAEAQYALGNIYASGLGVKQDDLQAVIWWKKLLLKEILKLKPVWEICIYKVEAGFGIVL
jgi:TPR repeat protein